MQYDNPAARLLSILTEGKNIGGSESCRKSWAGLLNTHRNDAALLMSRLGKLMVLPQEVIDQTKQLFPNQRPTWEHWSRQLDTGFSTQNLNGRWETFINHIDDHTLTYLAMSADLLESKSEIKSLDSESLAELRGSINELLDGVLKSDAETGLKKYLVHHLRKILIALDEYKITGALPILDAVETTIGHAYLDEEYRGFLTNTEIGARILETLSATAHVVTVAVGVPQLAHGFVLLGGGG